MKDKKKNPHAVALRAIKSDRRAAASRENGQLGGRPAKEKIRKITDQERRDYLIENLTELIYRTKHCIELLEKLDVHSEREEDRWHRYTLRARVALTHIICDAEQSELKVAQ